MAAMTPARKRLAMLFVVIGAGLIVEHTLALSGGDVVAPVGAVAVPASSSNSAPARPKREAMPELHLDLLARRTPMPAPPASDSLFAVQSWQPAAPPVPAPPPPQAPMAPAFPYPYIGGLSDDGGRTAFFSRGDRVLALHGGETVDGAYRVDHVDDKQMTLTYLPFQQTVTVALGGGR